MRLKTILHPTDFSESSQLAFELACSLADDYGAKLIILHVVPPESTFFGEGVDSAESEQFVEARRTELLGIQPKRIDVVVEHRLAQGDTVQEIVRVARECRPDFMVIGTHGRSGLSRLLMGSVAESLVRRSPCPVVSVKVPVHHDSAESHGAKGVVAGVWP